MAAEFILLHTCYLNTEPDYIYNINIHYNNEFILPMILPVYHKKDICMIFKLENEQSYPEFTLFTLSFRAV